MSDEKKRSRWLAIGAVTVVAATLAFLALGNIGEDLVYYWSPSELLDAANKAEGATVRLGGQVEPGSIIYGDDGLDLKFRVTDGGTSVAVHARAVPPAMFREEIGVVVEGSMDASGTFQARRLMVKHDNE